MLKNGSEDEKTDESMNSTNVHETETVQQFGEARLRVCIGLEIQPIVDSVLLDPGEDSVAPKNIHA